jgi:hypothetical protein
LSKAISTDQNPENIARVLEILHESPARLEALIGPDSGIDPHQPLGEGERSPVQVLAHLVNVEAISSDHIVKTLVVKTPRLVVIHAERHFGKLLQFQDFSIPELLAYFRLRRTALLRVLEDLTPAKWARTMDKGIKRMESVYWAARGLALHELEHIEALAERL